MKTMKMKLPGTSIIADVEFDESESVFMGALPDDILNYGNFAAQQAAAVASQLQQIPQAASNVANVIPNVNAAAVQTQQTQQIIEYVILGGLLAAGLYLVFGR